jgi:hypothetical protein
MFQRISPDIRRRDIFALLRSDGARGRYGWERTSARLAVPVEQ